MENIIENVNIDSDPRFLFDVSSMMKLLPTQKDIDSRIMIAKKAVWSSSVEDVEEKRRQFLKNNVALVTYEWIDFSDFVTCYFIWYFMLLTIRDKSDKEIDKRLSFSVDVAFVDNMFDIIHRDIPRFPEQTSKFKVHTIIFLHFLFSETKTYGISQREFLDAIKRKFLEFRRSPFFRLTLEDNEDRALWTEERLNNDRLKLPQEIPATKKAHSLSLAISLFLWDQSSQFSINTSGEEHIVGKSVYVHKLNLSWNQYKHREKNKLKKVKAYSFEMEESLQKKIDHLSRALDMKKNRLIEYLIEQEYTKQTKK
ncbi:hypothetical protein M5215_001447 [Vibrio vulnificus]|nr:hypothetical protein [Vibrio vulnificus]EKA7341497.1 hypothetical protein [Vibrio vulnificus]EKD9324955.1 hypothetical protein [Vibrio vulnificus]ELQ2339967.1 hypothetical protein [Vibrio vulnificus]